MNYKVFSHLHDTAIIINLTRLTLANEQKEIHFKYTLFALHEHWVGNKWKKEEKSSLIKRDCEHSIEFFFWEISSAMKLISLKQTFQADGSAHRYIYERWNKNENIHKENYVVKKLGLVVRRKISFHIYIVFLVCLFEANTFMAFHVITLESFTVIHFYYLEKTHTTSPVFWVLHTHFIDDFNYICEKRVNETADARCRIQFECSA